MGLNQRAYLLIFFHLAVGFAQLKHYKNWFEDSTSYHGCLDINYPAKFVLIHPGDNYEYQINRVYESHNVSVNASATIFKTGKYCVDFTGINGHNATLEIHRTYSMLNVYDLLKDQSTELAVTFVGSTIVAYFYGIRNVQLLTPVCKSFVYVVVGMMLTRCVVIASAITVLVYPSTVTYKITDLLFRVGENIIHNLDFCFTALLCFGYGYVNFENFWIPKVRYLYAGLTVLDIFDDLSASGRIVKFTKIVDDVPVHEYLQELTLNTSWSIAAIPKGLTVVMAIGSIVVLFPLQLVYGLILADRFKQNGQFRHRKPILYTVILLPIIRIGLFVWWLITGWSYYCIYELIILWCVWYSKEPYDAVEGRFEDVLEKHGQAVATSTGTKRD
ncbi:hypothetical protein SBY92_000715 [Candida maltosa Xu316]